MSARILLAFVALLGLASCRSLPPLDARVASAVITETGSTRLGLAVAPRAAAHPGLSGIHPLIDPRDAFAARALLARAAERTLDVQYYIWRADLSGTLLLHALHEAAGRGVRVRLLLDDNNTGGLDAALAALDAHPNVEVRLFNPFAIRAPRALGFLTDFSRLNRRMHNKSFTADNQATIVGGRNVGDEYFDATAGVAFIDLDVMAIGPIVGEVSADFDRYWASGSSYPVALLVPPADAAQARQAAADAVVAAQAPEAAAYLQAMHESPFVRELVAGRLPLQWARTRMVSDDPAKALGQGSSETRLPALLRRAIGEPRRELELASAYFVPGAQGVEALVAMARRGVRVSVLTNALEATDVPAVHAGYAKRRQALLEGGVRLYELRRQAGGAARERLRGIAQGSSGSSLHAKTFSVDRATVFVGSFNFDPRSAHLNTEMGFVIDSPELARDIAAVFDHGLQADAYEVRLDAHGLHWLERQGEQVVRHDTEPGTRWWQRAAVRVLALLPIEWLL